MAKEMQRQPGFWGFFVRLFASPPKPAPKRRSAVRTRSSASPAPAELPETFGPYAELLGVEVVEPPPLTDEEWEQVVVLKGQLAEKLSEADVAPQAVPATALRVLNLVASDDPDVGELARAVGHDPGISSGVLRVANSAAVAGTHTISSVRDAVARLGTEEVGRVAGAIAARSLFSPQTRKQRSVFEQRFYDLHLASVQCAAGASQLAMQLRKGRSDTAYLGGMLHDIGKSVVLVALSRLVLEGGVDRNLPQGVVDTVLEELHVDVGAELHLEWALPDALTELCACHHDANVPDQEGFEDAHLVRVIGGLLALRREPAPTHGTDALLQSAQVLGITPQRLRAIDAELRQLGERMTTILRA